MLARLTEETQPQHADAERDIDDYLFRRPVTVADYREFLERLYGFLVPVELALAATPNIDEVIDVKARAKSALVMHDLLALGMSAAEIAELPLCPFVPVIRGRAVALGWLFVVERPLLAAPVIRGHLTSYLQAEMAFASAYLACYQGQVGSMWRELGEAMERVAASRVAADCMVAAAQDAFRALDRWRRIASVHVPPPGIAIAG